MTPGRNQTGAKFTQCDKYVIRMSDSPSRNKIIALCGLFIASVVVYLPTIKYGFVWDDALVLSSEIHGIKGYGLFLGGGDYYRPFLALCHGLDYALWGAYPAGFHLTNILLNAFCTPLVFLIALSLFGEERFLLALSSAVFFMLNPLHADSAAWISGRTDIIASLFFFLAFLSYIVYREKNDAKGIALSCLFFLFALFGKENAFFYPFVLLAYDRLVKAKRMKESLVPMVVHFFVIVLYFSLRKFPHIAIHHAALAPGADAAQAGAAVWPLQELWYCLGYYANKLIFPFHLSIFPNVDSRVNIFMFLLFSAILIFASYKRSAVLSFGLAFIILTLLPSLPVIFMTTVPTPVAARYLYLPVFGLSIALAWAAGRIGNEKARMAVIGIIVVIYSAGLYSRVADWKNDLSLWRRDATENSDSASARSLYAVALYRDRHYAEAEKEVVYILSHMNSLRVKRSAKKDLFANLLNTLGLMSMEKKDFPQAERSFAAALSYNSDDRSVYHNLGTVYLSEYNEHKGRGLLEKANLMYGRASAIDPLYLNSLYGLAYTSQLLGRKEQAVKYYNKIIDLDPGNPMARMAMKELLSVEGR